MASLTSVWFKLETLETMVATLKAKGKNGISVDISLNDTTNEHGQNVAAFVSQTKEERDAKKKRFYVANGKTFWNDGKIVNAIKKEDLPTASTATAQPKPADIDDLPF